MSNYREGIEQWKRCKQIRSPFIDTNISSYPKRMFIGYAGMDEATANLLIHGKNRTDLTESARWGHACYVADNPALYNYSSFSHDCTYPSFQGKVFRRLDQERRVWCQCEDFRLRDMGEGQGPVHQRQQGKACCDYPSFQSH